QSQRTECRRARAYRRAGMDAKASLHDREGRMSGEVSRAVRRGLLSTVVLGVLILVGSRNLAHFDAALVAYTFSILFATFGLTYRYSMWLSRPPTAMYWRRGWQA